MIALASDHGGLGLKAEIKKLLEERRIPYRDFGTESEESCDYARYAYPAAMAVVKGECEKAILVCGTGIGMSLAANKVKGIRCAVCSDCFTAELSRKHNNANALALGERVVGPGLGRLIVAVWLDAEFEAEERHIRRLEQVAAVEAGREPC